MIVVKNLSYSYGRDPIFVDTSFVINKNSKVGLVGVNGSGKSTLFKIISRKIEEDEGRVETYGEILSVPQEVKNDPEMEKAKSTRQYLDPKNIHEDYEILRILSKMELGYLDLDSLPINMSGGQKTKLAICRALILEPDILLMDEPTNFLDTAGKKWVMEFLGRYSKTVIIISHDLALLDNKIEKILEINQQTHKIEEYAGNYSDYTRLKEEKDALLVRQIHVQERHIVRMKKGLLKMSHVKSSKGVRQRLQLEKRIDKMEESLPAMPPEAKRIRINLPKPAWVGSMPIIASGVCKKYGNNSVLNNVDFEIRKGERIALMGQNGAGKSTLIKILMERVKADWGTIVRDENLKVGYYSQEFETFDFEKNLLETVRETCQMTDEKLRPHLGRFLFSGERVKQKVGSLSGGEKTRLSIASILAKDYNLLVLDEPTTYLDVLSQRLILEAVKLYEGAMIVVSHTPEFIAELDVDKKFYLPENEWERCK